MSSLPAWTPVPVAAALLVGFMIVREWRKAGRDQSRMEGEILPAARMTGEVPVDGTALTEWEEDRLEQIEAGLTGQPWWPFTERRQP